VVGWDWVHLVRRPLFGLLYQPRMINNDYDEGDDDDNGDECWAVGGMRLGRGNRSIRRKPTPVSPCLQQIAHDLTWPRTRAAAVGNRRLTAWAMARPIGCIYVFLMIVIVNSSCSHKQYLSFDLCSGDVTFFLWGTNWIFICYLEEIHSLNR
jgi:hypothetical protein